MSAFTVLSLAALAISINILARALRVSKFYSIRYEIFRLRENLTKLHLDGHIGLHEFQMNLDTLNFLARNVRMTPLYLLISLERAVYFYGLTDSKSAWKKRMRTNNKQGGFENKKKWYGDVNNLLILIVETYSPFRLARFTRYLSGIPGIGGFLSQVAKPVVYIPCSWWFLRQILTRTSEPVVKDYLAHIRERSRKLETMRDLAIGLNRDFGLAL
jgi:hypothetical protein